MFVRTAPLFILYVTLDAGRFIILMPAQALWSLLGAAGKWPVPPQYQPLGVSLLYMRPTRLPLAMPILPPLEQPARPVGMGGVSLSPCPELMGSPGEDSKETTLLGEEDSSRRRARSTYITLRHEHRY